MPIPATVISAWRHEFPLIPANHHNAPLSVRRAGRCAFNRMEGSLTSPLNVQRCLGVPATPLPEINSATKQQQQPDGRRLLQQGCNTFWEFSLLTLATLWRGHYIHIGKDLGDVDQTENATSTAGRNGTDAPSS